MNKPKRNLDQTIAFVISRLLGPLPLLCLLWLVTAFKSGIGFWKAIWVYPLIFIVAIGVPFAISTYILIRPGGPGIEWPTIGSRRKLYPIFLFSGSLALVLAYFLTSPTIFHLSLLAGLIAALIYLITTLFKFKISVHTALASGVFWGINFLTHFKFWWLFFFLIPIVWSRYVLKVHNLSELLAGIILTNSLIIIAILLFGLPKIS